MMNKKVALHNLGCKVNAYETEAMQQMLEKAGYQIVPFEPGADVYIINTCTVTNIADRKSRQMLHKAKKMNPDAVVVAAGCYVQAAEEKLLVDDAVDIVIGNNKKQDLLLILENFGNEEEGCQHIIDVNHTAEFENLSLTKTSEHTRAYIKVQDGCNQFCSYCIIPFARGRVRSRKQADILHEVEALAAGGYQEVVLTGIHLSSYGVDFDGGRSGQLLSLIQEIHKVPGIARIRLGSLEPGIITEAFVEALAGLEKFCPHFHLSLQSGCDSVLKRMNRRYTTGEYYDKCVLIRRYFPQAALTTDIIVGFPQETEAEFTQTLEFVRQAAFYEIHVFKYSLREGTKAAAMEGQVAEADKTVRSKELIALQEQYRKRYQEQYLNREVEVLFEERRESDGEAVYTGYTKEYIKIVVKSQKNLVNCRVRVCVTGAGINGFEGFLTGILKEN